VINEVLPRPFNGASEIVGFGALNVDYIASASRLTERMHEEVSESTARFEWNREGPTNEATIMDAIRRLGVGSLACSLGGSAWLTISAMAHLGLGLRLGYVGVVGRVEAPGLSFSDQMDELGIDRRWVGRRLDLPCGLCLSYLEDTDRVMLTHPGANFEVGTYLKENFADIVNYVASARYVHVTSFFDEVTPMEVFRVLSAAKQRNPGLRVSFDPGFDWAAHVTEAIAGILGLTDLLFVNYREFKELGGYTVAEPDDAIAARVLAKCDKGCTIFVTKKYDFVAVFRSSAAGLVTDSFQQPAAAAADLEDATGAGDVFSAGVLAALVSDRMTIKTGAEVGLRLARRKLINPTAREQLDLRRGFLRRAPATREPSPPPRDVFIVHDGNPQWQAVQRFVDVECGLRTFELSMLATSGAGTAMVMGDLLRRCGFAVCVLSVGDAPPGGRYRLDQDLVHQVGLFQGRYGFGRVALLAEEGCETFSNIAGLIRLDFPVGRVDAVLLELERMFVREGLLRRKGDGNG
jgi:sugar/nucleoside kinase (ribokinase family)